MNWIARYGRSGVVHLTCHLSLQETMVIIELSKNWSTTLILYEERTQVFNARLLSNFGLMSSSAALNKLTNIEPRELGPWQWKVRGWCWAQETHRRAYVVARQSFFIISWKRYLMSARSPCTPSTPSSRQPKTGNYSQPWWDSETAHCKARYSSSWELSF